MINRPQFRRIRFIHRQLQENRYPNATSIANNWHIECSPRTVKRDIEYMRDEWNAPIEYDASKRGYYYFEQGYELPSMMMITEGELFSLSIAEHILEQYRDTPVFHTLKNTFSKIEEILPEAVTVNKNWIDTMFSFNYVPGVEIDAEVWDVLFDGLRTLTKVRIWYKTPPYDDSLERTISPYHIICNDAKWYVIGHDSRSEDIRLFALHRIEQIQRTRNSYAIPGDFSYKDYIDAPLGMYINNEAYDVKLLFGREAAHHILEREWHPEQTVTEAEGGSVLLSFRTRQLTSVLHWVLSWGGSVKVLGPERLIEMVKENLAEARARYE
jgi:predicted DNA-binding transcriptional regulator YafY